MCLPQTVGGSVIRFGEWTALPDALVVLGGIVADDLAGLHLHAEVLFYEINGGENGEEGISLAAPGSANLTDLPKRACSHLVGECERLDGQGRGLGNDGDEHAGTDACPARAPEAAGAAGNIPPAVHHLRQCALQVDIAASVFIGGQQRGTHHHMMLRPVHMAKGHSHHFLDDRDGVF